MPMLVLRWPKFLREVVALELDYLAPMFRNTPILLLLLLLRTPGWAQQDTATIMCYNVLNFPTFNLAGREDTLRNIIQYIRPDILLLQELKTDSGLQLIVEESFADLGANYASTTFVPQQSNAVGGFRLQQAMVYNTDMFGVKQESTLLTGTRDINKTLMYYKDSDPQTTADTIFFLVFNTHLKSSQGSANEERRLEMAQTFTFHQQYLPQDAAVIFAGDLNLYGSNEPAYQELTDSTNTIVMVDPIDSPGNWASSSFMPRSIHTQSTRASSIFGDGAGGGVDNRFDFILLSENFLTPYSRITYVADSYDAVGNTGNCYNQSITACTGGSYPDHLLQSLYYMSDHLPVVLDVVFHPSQRTSVNSPIHPEVAVYPNPCADHLQVRTNGRVQHLTLFDLQGKAVAYGTGADMQVHHVHPGLYVLQGTVNGLPFAKQVVVDALR